MTIIQIGALIVATLLSVSARCQALRTDRQAAAADVSEGRV